MPGRIARISLICAYEPCSKPFEVLPSAFKRGARYHSQQCVLLALKERSLATLVDRFWAKVYKGAPAECWIWQGTTVGKGYGALYVFERGRQIGAHIVSWYLHHGEWPEANLHVLHNCPNGMDRPDCVNPSHLWLGTHTDNVHDMHAKGRSIFQKDPERATAGLRHWGQEHHIRPEISGNRNGTHTHPESVLRGEKHPNSKLTDTQWAELFTLWNTGQWTKSALARRFDISKVRVGQKIREHQAEPIP